MPPTPSAAQDPLVTSFRSDGYTVVARALPQSTLDRVEAVLDRFESEYDRYLATRPGRRQWISEAAEITFTARLAGRDPLLRLFLSSAPLADLAVRLVGPHVRLYFDQAVYKKPFNNTVVPWHQDNGYNPKVPESYITAWIPLTDATLDNGCVRVQPGRHGRGTFEHWQTDAGFFACEEGCDGGEPVPVSRGDVLVFSSLLPHATGPNRTPSTRKAYLASFVAEGTRLATGAPCDDPVDQFVVARDGRPTDNR